MPGTEINNEQVVDKPKTKEEKQKERLQKKLDKLHKKEEKFNDKLAKLNNDITEDQNNIITKTKDKMNVIIGSEISTSPNSNYTTILKSNVGLQKNIYNSKNTIAVGGNMGLGVQLNNNNVPTGSTPSPDVPTTLDEIGVEGPNTITEEGNTENTNTGGYEAPPIAENNTKNPVSSNIYINPELYIKSKNDKGLTLGGTIGGKFGTNKKMVYTQGSIGYESKGGFGIQAIGGMSANLSLEKTKSISGITTTEEQVMSDDNEDNSGSGLGPNKKMSSDLQLTQNNVTIEKNNKTNISPYGGLKVYKNFGNFSTYISGNISGAGPTVSGGVTYKF